MVFFRKGILIGNDNSKKEPRYLDRGDLVQTIIIIAGLAVAAIVAIGGITSVLMTKGESTAKCISNFNAMEVERPSFENDCRTFKWEVFRDSDSVRTYSIKFDDLETFTSSRDKVISDCSSMRMDIDYTIGTKQASLTYECTIFADEGVPSGSKPGLPTNFNYAMTPTKVLW